MLDYIFLSLCIGRGLVDWSVHLGKHTHLQMWINTYKHTGAHMSPPYLICRVRVNVCSSEPALFPPKIIIFGSEQESNYQTERRGRGRRAEGDNLVCDFVPRRANCARVLANRPLSLLVCAAESVASEAGSLTSHCDPDSKRSPERRRWERVRKKRSVRERQRGQERDRRRRGDQLRKNPTTVG